MPQGAKITEINGKIYGILNWHSRKNNEDVLVAAPLSAAQLRRYRKLTQRD